MEVPTGPYGQSVLDMMMGRDGSAVGRLRRQRKADCKPKKPKPVTDEQLLAIVDELEAKIKKQADAVEAQILTEGMAWNARVESLEKYVNANCKLKMFAPVKHSGVGRIRSGR